MGGCWEAQEWGIDVNIWLIPIIVQQKLTQCCETIILQLKKTKNKKKKNKHKLGRAK